MVGGPEGNILQHHPKWMDGRLFLKHGLKYVADIPKPIVVFFDGHGSHITYDTAFKAKEANVHIICLPPPYSHWMSESMVLLKRFGIRFFKCFTGSLDSKP